MLEDGLPRIIVMKTIFPETSAYFSNHIVSLTILFLYWFKEYLLIYSYLGRSPGGENGNPLQYSYLGNPMNRGAWRATVHSVAKSQTQLKQLSTPRHMST